MKKGTEEQQVRRSLSNKLLSAANVQSISSPEYTSDLFDEIINSILVEDDRFIWNFSYNKTANADMNMSDRQ